ncbi:putative 26S proteasome regulatory subunit [Pseudocyphellaria aurata]|nr:putative 26S proteasome regulatory subunit [Pseudocyphellaria aurata]
MTFLSTVQAYLGFSFSKPADTVAERYIAAILNVHHALSQLPNLDPSPEVNSLFSELVALCIQTPDEQVAARILSDGRINRIIPHLRQLCSEGESQLEAYWAKKITACGTEHEGKFDICMAPDVLENKQYQCLTQLIAAMNMLRQFTYYSNYVDLTRLELSMILALSVDPPRIFAFIGSGPLPLSSLCIAASLSRENGEKVVVHNIDNHHWAIKQSSEMCRALGSYAERLQFQCAEATAAEGLEAYDVVYLASLVGPTQTQKKDIISNLVQRMRPGALLVLRSAHSLRSLLYPLIDVSSEMAFGDAERLITMHPYNHLVNSVVICRVKPRRDDV